MKIDSREYKVVIDGQLLANVASGLARIVGDAATVGRQTGMVVLDEFESNKPKERLVRFLDTPDCILKENDLLLRQRLLPRDDTTEYTLKCRSADRYIAAAADVSAAKGFDPEEKLEDDIGPPFVSRLSHSVTIEVVKKFAGERFPETVEEASKVYPGLLKVRHGGRVCSPKTRLRPVSDPPVVEQLFRGPTLKTGQGDDVGPLALILWTRGEKGKVLIAELSFRHEEIQEIKIRGMAAIASAAKRFFEELQRQEWARPEAIGKTEFMYQLRRR